MALAGLQRVAIFSLAFIWCGERAAIICAQQLESPALAANRVVSPLIERDFRVLDLSGTPYERGLAHGRALPAEIRELLAAFQVNLGQTYGITAAEFTRQFLAETDFRTAIEDWAPELLDEVRGIADGAELPFDEIFVYQLADEIWSMGRWAVREKCTAIAVNRRGDQPTLVAQNMDLPGFYQKYPTLLRIDYAERPDQLVLTCPGLIGVNGMNSAGVAVCCNTLLQLKPSPQGIPCLFLVRGVLEQRSLADAAAWMQRVPHAVGQNYTLGDRTAARALECSASQHVEYRPVDGGDFTFHTNHPLVNTDWHPEYVERCAAKQCTPVEGLPSCQRLVSLKQRIRRDAPITAEVILAALASRDQESGSICGDWTYATTIYVLGDKPYCRFTPGRPDRYRAYDVGFE